MDHQYHLVITVHLQLEEEVVVDTAAEHLLRPMEHLQVVVEEVVEDTVVEHLQGLLVHTVLLQRQRP